MSEVPLGESATAIAGANGIARVTLGPMRAFEQWDVSSTTVASTSSVLTPTARTYRGAESPSRRIDSTYTGTDDTSDTQYTLRSGERLVVVWTGCDIGAQCTVTIEGKAVR